MNEEMNFLTLAKHIAKVELQLSAETTALRLAVRALMQTSVQPEKALQTCEVLFEQHLSVLLASGAQDARFEALQRATGEVRGLLKNALAQHQASGS